MATSLVYDYFLTALGAGSINLTTDTYYAMLVNGYAPNKASDQFRSNVTNETTGTGYTSGGVQTAQTVATNTTSNQLTVTFANVSWANATITATGAVIYKHTGTATTDTLIAYVDFGQAVSSTNASFSVTFSSPLTFQN